VPFDIATRLSHVSRPLLHGLLLMLLGMPLAAAGDSETETRWYDVEVIIFSQTSQQFRDSELWPMDIALPEMKNARPLLPAAKVASRSAAADPVPFTLLDSEAMTLDAEAARIKAAPELELLLHLGWRQPGLSQEQAVSVKVYDGMLEDGGMRSASDGSMAPAEPHRMEGTLKLVLSRYLHIYADLLYREPLPEGISPEMMQTSPLAAEPAPLQTTADTAERSTAPDLFDLAADPFSSGLVPRYRVYRMQQSRRMRSNELHYLDHPVLGMIIRATPYELPKGETPADANPASSS